MISAVLLRWKRESELWKIYKRLEKNDLIDEIIVWDNRKINLINYGRYLGALEAKYNTIYVQDDDCYVNNIDALVNNYTKKRPISNIKPSHMQEYKVAPDTMAGWGMLFEKEWIGILNKYIRLYGIDYVFLRETDRIFTGLFKEFDYIVADVEDFPSARDPKIALFQQPNHFKMRAEARKRVKHINEIRSQ